MKETKEECIGTKISDDLSRERRVVGNNIINIIYFNGSLRSNIFMLTCGHRFFPILCDGRTIKILTNLDPTEYQVHQTIR